jgi:hypothetical protein
MNPTCIADLAARGLMGEHRGVTAHPKNCAT